MHFLQKAKYMQQVQCRACNQGLPSRQSSAACATQGGEGSRGQNQGPGPVLRALVPACMQCSLGEGKLHRPSAWVVDTAEEQEQEQGRGGGDSNPQAPGATAAAAAVPLTTSLLQELVPAAPKVSSAGDIAQQQQQQQELQVQPWQLHDPLARVANELGAQLALLAQDAEGRGKPSGQGFNSLAALSQLPGVWPGCSSAAGKLSFMRLAELGARVGRLWLGYPQNRIQPAVNTVNPSLNVL